MPNLDTLPGDQRAVLQLVLGRGRSYDEIARLLSVDPEAVRARARAALDALGPATRVGEADRQLVCDYLLGQLPAADVPAARALVAGSPPERAWAQALAAELAPLARGALPEIPAAAAATAPAGPTAPVPPVTAPPAAAPPAPVTPTPPPATPTPPPVAPVEVALGAAAGAAAAGSAGDAEAASKRRRRGRGAGKAEKPAKPKRPSRRERRAAKAVADDDGEGARSSRVGGLIVIFVTVLVIAAIVVLVTRHHHATPVANRGGVTATNPATTSTTSTASASATSTTSGTTSASAKPIAQINLTATRSGSSAAAIAEVLQQGSERELAIVGQDVPANTAHNSYEVWLYNSPTDAVSLGFVNPGVTSSGKLSAAGPLPADAGSYHRLIVTTETTAKPKRPGPILLSGAISGL